MMDFDEFWVWLAMKLGSRGTFKTLKQSSVFEAVMINPYEVVVEPKSTGEPRVVRKKEFQQMWDIMKDDIRSQRYVNRNGRYYEFWSMSYIGALIDDIVADQPMQ